MHQAQSGQVLVRNRRFIRKRTALSIYAPAVPAAALPEPLQPLEPPPPAPDPAPSQVAPRRSGRETHRPARLIEDDTWC